MFPRDVSPPPHLAVCPGKEQPISPAQPQPPLPQGHPVCEPCKLRPEVRYCPTCRQRIVGRATLVEKIAAQVFSDKVSTSTTSITSTTIIPITPITPAMLISDIVAGGGLWFSRGDLWPGGEFTGELSCLLSRAFLQTQAANLLPLPEERNEDW